MTTVYHGTRNTTAVLVLVLLPLIQRTTTTDVHYENLVNARTETANVLSERASSKASSLCKSS